MERYHVHVLICYSLLDGVFLFTLLVTFVISLFLIKMCCYLCYMFILFEYSCFEKGCPTKRYGTMPKGIMCNWGSWSLIEALSVSATQRKTARTNVSMLSLFLLVNTVNFNQSTPNSLYP